jgi:Na+-transporting methylmalonyl-CoA/oxaloacetate decarboxylase gamma subunit
MIENLYKALDISVIGIAGVFVFMMIFLGIIVAIDKFFPYKEEEQA